jgi:cytochrome c oxidase cbb3-type subunit III
MMRLLLALLCALGTATLGHAQERNPRTSPADVAAGASTFRSHCSACHGMEGAGGRGPNLASGRFYHGSSDTDLLNNISNGIPGTEMPGLFYSPDRVWQIVAYIRSLNAPGSAAAGGDAKRGAALFQSKGCTTCHRVAGEGGRLGPDLTEIGKARSPDYLRRSIVDPGANVAKQFWVLRCSDASGKQYEGYVLNEDTYTVQFIDMNQQLHSLTKSGLKRYAVEKISKMPSYKDKLSDAELRDLVSYLSSLREQGEAQ